MVSRSTRDAPSTATRRVRDHVARIAGFTGAYLRRSINWILLATVLVLIVAGAACGSPTPKFLQGATGDVDQVFRPVLTDVYGEVIEPTGSLVGTSGNGSVSRTVSVRYSITGPVDENRDFKSELASRLEKAGVIVNSATGSQSQYTLEYSVLRVSNDSGSGTVRATNTKVTVNFKPN